MKVLRPRCAGLDVHKDTVVVCARMATARGVTNEIETFGTTTGQLLALSDWLSKRKVTEVAMESTGVYWKPVWHVLSGTVELLLVNAAHARNVPGRKTDVNDATWLAELHAHGLLRPSFVPETPTQDLRTLTRTRRQLIQERSRHTQRIQKVLEDANIKLSSFIADIMGPGGRKVLTAIVGGESDPDKLVDLMYSKRFKASRQTLSKALTGYIRDHHRFMLKLHLDQIDAIAASIDSIEREVASSIEPFRIAAQLLTTMPGIAFDTAWVIVAEIGIDMSRFPSADHLVSWARLCPRNDRSADKRRSRRIMPGRHWLKPVLVQAAWAAVRVKGTYFRAKFLRLKARRGPKKAIIAVASSMLTATYHMLRDGTEYHDLGDDHFDRFDKEKYAKRLVRKLRECGFEVQLREAA